MSKFQIMPAALGSDGIRSEVNCVKVKGLPSVCGRVTYHAHATFASILLKEWRSTPANHGYDLLEKWMAHVSSVTELFSALVQVLHVEVHSAASIFQTEVNSFKLAI